jgi:endoglycosylceramidase
MSILNISSFLISVRANGKYFGTGFTQVPGGDDYRNRSVLSYHYYCTIISIIPVPGNATIPGYERLFCDDVEGPALLRSVQTDLIQLGGSAFLTEFGGCDDTPTCDEQLNWSLDGADQFLQSWAFWGNVLGQNRTIYRIARIYPHAIAGKPLAMQYIAAQRIFYLSYYIDPNIKQPTEIYVPSIQFPQQSYNVTVNSVLKWRVDPTNMNIILVEPNEQLVKSKEQAVIGTVDIRPTM